MKIKIVFILLLSVSQIFSQDQTGRKDIHIRGDSLGQVEARKFVMGDYDFVRFSGTKIIDGFAISSFDNDSIVSARLWIEFIKTDWVMINGTIFNRNVLFNTISVNGEFSIAMKCRFNRDVIFRMCIFKEIEQSEYKVFNPSFLFENSKVNGDLIIDLCTFDRRFYLQFMEIDGYSSFYLSNFNNLARFYKVKFNRSVDLSRVKFTNKIELEEVVFNDTIDLTDSYFENGLDLRRSELDSVHCIFLEGMEYPTGKFYVNWDQINYKDSPLIQVDTIKVSESYVYKKLEKIYTKLRDNYVMQGDKNTADNVMYELEMRKDEVLGGFLHKIYGIFFGYGYEPWRYLLFIVLPLIIIYAFILYVLHYQIIVKILDSSTSSSQIVKIKNNFRLPYYKLTTEPLSENNNVDLPFLARMWHSLVFSTSVILGFRFKKVWIHKFDKSFLKTISIGWILGVGLYLLFAIYVKGQRFEAIKGLLGL